MTNSSGDFLLGKRRNSPAKGFLFFPGGRIFKNEKIENAIVRILREETGMVKTETNPEFIGVFEHFYEDNFCNERNPNSGTHYVALGFAIEIDSIPDQSVFLNQHSEMVWISKIDLLSNPMVHEYCKEYFSRIDRT